MEYGKNKNNTNLWIQTYINMHISAILLIPIIVGI